MFYVRLEVGKKVKIDRWLTRSSIAKVNNPLVSTDLSMDQVKQGTEVMNSGDGETTDDACTDTARANDPETATGTASIELETAKKKKDDSETTRSMTTDENDSEKSHGTTTGAPDTTASTKDGRRRTIDDIASTSISSKVVETGEPETEECLTPTSRIIIGVPGASSSECSSDHDL